MTKRKHHFVPRFYLRAFQSEPGRIHLCNLKRSLTVENASLRDQCYKRKFYGTNNILEDQLAKLEGCIAPVLQSIIAKDAIPSFGSDNYLTLLAFVAMQALRTPTSADQVNQIVDKVMKQAHSNGLNSSDVDVEAMRFGFNDPVLMSLRLLEFMWTAIPDLRAQLIVSPNEVFLTSDNPVYRYNQYCEGTRHMGTTGFFQCGIQFFVPLSPRHQLVLYDSTTYDVKLPNRLSGIRRPKQSDIDSLNKMQLISANENVYFSDWQQLQDIKRLHSSAKHLRSPDPTVVQEYGQDGDPNSSLIHTHKEPTNMSLKLTFMSVKRRARKVPIADRPRSYRYERQGARSAGTRGRGITFSRFLGRR